MLFRQLFCLRYAIYFFYFAAAFIALLMPLSLDERCRLRRFRCYDAFMIFRRFAAASAALSLMPLRCCRCRLYELPADAAAMILY